MLFLFCFQALQTWHLLCIIAIPVLAMVVILFLGSVIPTVRPSAFLADDLENPSTTDVSESYN